MLFGIKKTGTDVALELARKTMVAYFNFMDTTMHTEEYKTTLRIVNESKLSVAEYYRYSLSIALGIQAIKHIQGIPEEHYQALADAILNAVGKDDVATWSYGKRSTFFTVCNMTAMKPIERSSELNVRH